MFNFWQVLNIDNTYLETCANLNFLYFVLVAPHYRYSVHQSKQSKREVLLLKVVEVLNFR